MNKHDRMLHILNLLRTRKNLNADKIAEECSVTERTIYRDMISLSEMNIPIFYDNGYKLASDNFLPPLNFSLDEYQLLKLALKSSPLIKTEKYQTVYKSLQAKIENCLSDEVVREKKFAPVTTHVDIQESISETEQKFYGMLEQAISSLTTIKLTYESISSGESTRLVDPYFIIFRGKAFYFVAYCHTKKDFRTFRINRIKAIGLTAETFHKSSDITPEQYFEGSWSVFSGEVTAVTIIFSGKAARIIRKTSHHKNEQIEFLDGNRLRYTVTVNGLEEIKRWLLGFGGEAEVVAPVELREDVRSIAQGLVKRYNS